MLTVALWDLGQGKRPALSSIPKYLRRVGADLVVLIDPPEGTSDTIGRHSGYRSRVTLSSIALGDAYGEVAIFARRGLVEDAATEEPGIARVTLNTGHDPLTLIVAQLDKAAGAQQAADLVSEHTGALVLAGDLGHNMANPQGAWALLRKDLIDHIEQCGASPLKERTHGFLSRGVQPRGGATLEKAAGGSSDLVWVRVAV